MNLGQNINFPLIAMVEVVLNQDSILDFPKCPHIFECLLFKISLLVIVGNFEILTLISCTRKE